MQVATRQMVWQPAPAMRPAQVHALLFMPQCGFRAAPATVL